MAPTMRVKTGERELSIPARELSIRVCAMGNRKLGMALPKIPMIRKLLIFFFVIYLRLWMEMGRKQSHVKNILKPAT